MIYVLNILLILIIFIIVPLAVNRGELKRIVLIALCLEVIKFLLLFTSIQSLLNTKNGIFGLIIAVFTVIVMLPELAIGYGHLDSISLWTQIAMFVGGVIWNLVPAYLISICLPEKLIDEEASTKSSSHIES